MYIMHPVPHFRTDIYLRQLSFLKMFLVYNVLLLQRTKCKPSEQLLPNRRPLSYHNLNLNYENVHKVSSALER